MPQPGVGRADFLALGDWNVFCSMCGKKRKASTVVRNWQGLYRCPEHDEPRQPQDFARGVPEDLQVPFVQELANSKFANICSINGQSAIPGLAIPGCMKPGNTFVLPPDPVFGFCTTLSGTFAVPGVAEPGCAVPGRPM